MLNNLLVPHLKLGDEQSKMMSPLRIALIVLFIGFPLIEIVVLIEVGKAIGFWATLGLLILSATAGMLIIRQQGLSMVGRMFESISRGGLAFVSMVDGYFVILAGCLLIVPGFVTDALGVALLIPPLRRMILGSVLPGFADARRDDRAGRAQPTARPADPAQPKQPIIIEGTYERIDDDDQRR
jgi:UPF0716 protein FxsA